MREKLFLGFLGLCVLFLLRRDQSKASPKIRPIDQNWMGSRYLGLLPYVEAQAVHESGNYSSDLVNRANNLFGMKRPTNRPFFGIGRTDNDYAVYRDWRQSVQDLFAWMDYTKFPVFVSGSGQYVAELKKRRYFEDNESNYLNGVNRALLDLARSGKKGFKITTV